MKNIFLPVIMGVLFFIGLTSMSSRENPGNRSCKQTCQELIQFGFFQSQGACMAACNVCFSPNPNPTKEAVCYCKQLDAIEGLENYGMNMGQCITSIRAGN